MAPLIQSTTKNEMISQTTSILSNLYYLNIIFNAEIVFIATGAARAGNREANRSTILILGIEYKINPRGNNWLHSKDPQRCKNQMYPLHDLVERIKKDIEKYQSVIDLIPTNDQLTLVHS